MPERTFDNFDNFSDDYRSVHSENVKLSGVDSLYFAEHKIIELKNFETDISQQVLDIGCGDGATEIFIQRHFPAWFTTGIDVSEKSLHWAKSRTVANTRFLWYNGKEIPFNDNSFDVVFVAAVLHHIDFSFHDAFIKEIYRVLKRGGRVYIFEHNPLNPATRYLVKTCIFDKNARLLRYRYTQQLLRAPGFELIQKRFILFFPRNRILSFLLHFEKKLSWLPLGAQYYFRAVK